MVKGEKNQGQGRLHSDTIKQFMKTEIQREKELFTLVPSQISPNPLRRKNTNSPLSNNSDSQSSFSSETSSNSNGLYCGEPVINFENLLQKRHGSVLGHEIILKSEHFFKGKHNHVLYAHNNISKE